MVQTNKIAHIVCMDKNRGIGNKGKLLHYLTEDLKQFKELTSGHSVLMGRKTYESLPNGALPNRLNIVMTRDLNYTTEDDAVVVHDIDHAITIWLSSGFKDKPPSLEEFAKSGGNLQSIPKARTLFVIGGQSIYKETYHMMKEAYVTTVYAKSEADTFYVDDIENDKNFKLISEKVMTDEEFIYTYRKYSKKDK